MKNSAKKPIVVAVSGGFDPLHAGHVRMFKKSKALGDKLVVIINNDNWLKNKKGYAFMPEKERAEIISGIRWVDEVYITKHKVADPDTTVCNALKAIKPDIFANGGDRPKKTHPGAEVEVCEKLGIKMVFGMGEGGKIQSSSWLIAKAIKEAPREVAVSIKK